MTDSTQSVDKSAIRVRQMFAEIAPKYDRMNHLFSMNVDRYWRRYTAKKLRPDRVHPILDCCTGTGDLAFALHRRARGQVAVVATDFCQPMLDIAEQKRARQGLNSISFIQADTQQLPFDDNTFQIVSVAFGLRNVERTEQGLAEMVRVCRPGGKVAVLEFTTPRFPPIRGMYKWYFKHILPPIGQALARNDSQAYNYLPQSVGEFPSYEELTALMVQSGLRQARFYPLTFGIATLYIGVK